MYARSPEFDAAIRKGHVVVASADVLLNGSVIAPDLPIGGGSVQVDGSAAVRRRCSLTVIDAKGTLTGTPTATVSPYGREIRTYRGLRLPNGAVEKLCTGTFRISSVATADSSSGDRSVKVEGFDRSRSVARARFETPYVIAAGTNYATAIQNLLSSRMPTLAFRFAATAATTPLLVFDQGADPWKSAQTMASSIGCLLYFDPLGVCVMVSVTDSATVVWDYSEGAAATVIGIDDTFDDEPGYNGVVVDGEATATTPVHAVVYDNDPASPTYYLGPYGRVPMFYRSQFITAADQAYAAAAGMLVQQRGGTEALRFTAIPHPAHEIGDLVRVASSTLGIDSNYYIDSFTIPHDLAQMNVTTRKRRLA